MEPLAVACVVCLYIIATCAVFATIRFIAWTHRWERQLDMHTVSEEEEPFPGDEWKYGKNDDEEDERA